MAGITEINEFLLWAEEEFNDDSHQLALTLIGLPQQSSTVVDSLVLLSF